MEPTQSSKENFWKTLPGVLTGIATLLTALGGFLLILFQVGILGSSDDPAKPNTDKRDVPNPDRQISPATVVPSSSHPQPAKLKAIADNVDYIVLATSTEEYSPSELKLTVTMKVSCNQVGVNFESDMFRLEFDGTKYAPVNNLSGQWIENHSQWKENLEFIIPKHLKAATLHVGRVGTGRIAQIQLVLS